ncbi:MAG: hypothetical protein U1E73_11860 [Planctomycetota bacterium]
MKNSGNCPKCKSDQVHSSVCVVDFGHADLSHDLKVTAFKNAKAILFRGRLEASLVAWICARCGFTELYVDAADRPAAVQGFRTGCRGTPAPNRRRRIVRMPSIPPTAPC